MPAAGTVATASLTSWSLSLTVDLRPSPTGVQPPGESGVVVTCACYHQTLPQLAVGVGRSILEYDVLTGCKLGTFSVDRPVIKLAYSPTHARSILGLLNDMTIRVWDTSTARGCVLFTPKGNKQAKDILWAVCPSLPRLYFASVEGSSVTMVETTAFLALAPPEKFKPDHRKPITALQCHPRDDLLVIGQADGTVGFYSLSTHQAVHSSNLDPDAKKAAHPLVFAFHSHENVLFIGDSAGRVAMWQLGRGMSRPLAVARPGGHAPVAWCSFHPLLRMLLVRLQGDNTQVRALRPVGEGREGGAGAAGLVELGAEDLRSSGLARGERGLSRECAVMSLLVHPRIGSVAAVLKGASPGAGPDAYSPAALQQLWSVPILAAQDRTGSCPGSPVFASTIVPFEQFLGDSDPPQPPRFYYCSGSTIMALDVSSNEAVPVTSIASPGGGARRPVRLRHSARRNVWVVLFEKDPPPGGGGGGAGVMGSALEYCVVLGSALSPNVSLGGKPARDAEFAGASDERIVVLTEDGHSLEIIATDQPDMPPERVIRLPERGMRLFPAPHGLGVAVGARSRVQIAAFDPSGPGDDPVATAHQLSLPPGESVQQMLWLEMPSGEVVCGVRTTHRVALTSSALVPLKSVTTPLNASAAGFGDRPVQHSCLWVGPSLLYSTPTQVRILSWDGTAHLVCSLDAAELHLVGALPDRLLLAQSAPWGARGAQTRVLSRAAALFQPLALGWVTLCGHPEFSPHSGRDLEAGLTNLLRKFDGSKVTWPLLEALVGGRCAGLAYELAARSEHVGSWGRFLLAIRALRFDVARDLLVEEYERSPDYPRMPARGSLRARVVEFSDLCCRFAQFSTAARCYDLALEYERVFDLYVAMGDPGALRALARQLDDPGLRAVAVGLAEAAGEGAGAAAAEDSLIGAIDDGSAGWAGSGGPGEMQDWRIDPPPGGQRWEIKSSIPGVMRVAGGGQTIEFLPTHAPESYVPATAQDNGGAPRSVSNHPISRNGSGGPEWRLGHSSSGNNSNDHRGGGSAPGSSAAGPSSFGAAGGAGVGGGYRDSDSESGPPSRSLSRQGSMADRERDGRGAGAAEEPSTMSAQAAAEEAFRRGFAGDDSSSSDDEGTTRRRRIQVKIKSKEEAARDAAGASPAILPPPPPGALGGGSAFKLPAPSPGGGLLPPPPSKAPSGGMLLPPPPSGGGDGGGGMFGGAPASYSSMASPQSPTPTQQQLMVANPFDDAFGGGAPPSVTSVGSTPGGAFPALSAPPSSDRHMGGAPSYIAPPGGGGPTSIDLGGGGGGGGAMAPFDASDLLGGGGGGRGPPSSSAGPSPPVSYTSAGGGGGVGGGGSGEAHAPPSPAAPRTAGELFKDGQRLLEARKLPQSLARFTEALAVLRAEAASGPGESLMERMRDCALYIAAVRLLAAVQKAEAERARGGGGGVSEAAHLSQALCGLRLDGRHRILCCDLAIRINISAGNYGFAKRQLEALLPKCPPAKRGHLQEMLRGCEQRGARDAHQGPGYDDEPEMLMAVVASVGGTDEEVSLLLL